MNEKVNLDLLSIKFIFDKNKYYILPVVIVLISVFLLFKFVIPQYDSLIAIREQAKTEKLKLNTLKENLKLLTKVNEEDLNSRFDILTSALPLDKNVVLLLNAIYSSAQKTGVEIGPFSFSLEDTTRGQDEGNIPVIKLSLPINSDAVAANDFIKTMMETVPLSQVDSFHVKEEGTLIDLDFYYLPQGVLDYDLTLQLTPVSKEGLLLIDQMNKFKEESAILQLPTAPVASPSAY